jgi:hypothetical protein
MAQRGGRLAGLVEAGDRRLELRVVAELEHRPLAAAHDQRVERVEVHVAQRRRALQLRDELRRAQRAQGDQVVGAPARRVARVAERVDLDLAALGRRDRHLVAALGELVVGVEQLGGPEAHGPAERGGGPGVGHDHEDVRAVIGVGDVDDLVMRVGL